MIKVFEKAFRLKENRNWDCIAVAVDLHGTVYRPTYDKKLTIEYYPHAKEVLQLLSKRDDVRMYMYTCSPDQNKLKYEHNFAKDGILIEATPHRIMNKMKIMGNSYQDFSEKPYFNVLLDDKAGFDPDRDWVALLKYLKERQ